MAVEIHTLEWDESGEEHIAKHGLTVREVNQVVATAYPATGAQQQVFRDAIGQRSKE